MPDNFIFIAFYFVLPKRTSPLAFHAAHEAHVRGVARSVPELVARDAQCAPAAPRVELRGGNGVVPSIGDDEF